jgi:hypothetical protein
MGAQATSPTWHQGAHRCEPHSANTGMRGGEGTEGPPNKKRGDGVSDGSLQSHSGANLNLKRVKNRGNVPKGGEADWVALTLGLIANYICRTRLSEFAVFGHPCFTNTCS